MNNLQELLAAATPEDLAATLNSDVALKKKLATALCAETIEDLQELMALTNCGVGAHALKQGKQKLPFHHLGKMQKVFIPATAAIPDPCMAYAQNVSNANARSTKENKQIRSGEKAGEINTYNFRIVRRPNGMLLMNVPSFKHHTWDSMVEEYNKYGLTPAEPTHPQDVEDLYVFEITQADITG